MQRLGSYPMSDPTFGPTNSGFRRPLPVTFTRFGDGYTEDSRQSDPLVALISGLDRSNLEVLRHGQLWQACLGTDKVLQRMK